MSAAPTLRLRLTLSIVTVLALVLGGFSLLLYAGFARALWRGLDARLDTEARALAEMAEEKAPGSFEFELEGISALPEFRDRQPLAYFQIWRPDGTVLVRSPSLAGRDLAGTDPGTLPDGRRGRLLAASLPAHWVGRQPPVEPRSLRVVVGRGTESEEAALARLRHLLWALGGLALLVAAGASAFTVWRGLRPAATLAGALDGVDAGHLGQRIAVPHLPRELEPAVAKLNELLARLDESFARERRFTADVSHELRTPLAGLRSLLEVATSRERSADEYRAVIGEAMDIVRQMHVLAEDLLMLARLDARQVEVLSEPIPLRALVDDTWRALAPRARERRLVFENAVKPEATLVSDPDKLRLVLRNLLANAAAYTEAGGRIEVRGGDGCLFEVWDSGPVIPPEVLPRLFERFFRADGARSGGSHSGIGLALVQAVCAPLRLAVTAANAPAGGVHFRVERR
jgi:two-component system heavy metal sensor histidine kinase CusS